MLLACAWVQIPNHSQRYVVSVPSSRNSRRSSILTAVCRVVRPPAAWVLVQTEYKAIDTSVLFRAQVVPVLSHTSSGVPLMCPWRTAISEQTEPNTGLRVVLVCIASHLEKWLESVALVLVHLGTNNQPHN